jgi:SAM-dependent methyltransferase
MKLFTGDGRYAGLLHIDFGIGPNDRVVDIGGGDKPYPKATHIIDMVDTNAQRHRRGLNVGDRELLEGDAVSVLRDYPDNYFDFMYSNHTFEHIEDLPAAIRQINRTCKRGFFALPGSDFEFMTAKPHFGHVNLCRLIEGVLHIAKRPQYSVLQRMAELFEQKLFRDPVFNAMWEGHGQRGFRHIWEIRHYWVGKIHYHYHEDPTTLFPQLEYFE